MEEQKQKKGAHAYINIGIFILLLLAGGILSFALPKKSISENEKRRLAALPVYSPEKLLAGVFTDSLDYYYADNFPFRENFIEISARLKEKFGIKQNEEVKLYTFEEKTAPAENLMQIAEADSIPAADSSKIIIDTSANNFEYVKSVFICDRRAFQLFGGTKRAAQNYAKIVNRYREELPAETRIYCLAMPTLVDFYLPEKYKKKSGKEKPNIDYLYEKLDSGVIPVRAYEEIAQHTNEYLYFNTDHHWTGLGAYYAYRAFCQSAGFTPYELDQFQHKTIRNFLGSLYHLTLNKDLKENIDSVVYYKFPVKTKTVYYLNEKDKTFYKSNILAEHARGPNAYSVFLGGDYPLIKVTSDVATPRKALLIKDSYGNAFAPYLALHFSEVYIVDYRYFNANLVEFIKKNGITDFIMGHNTFVINNPYAAIRERGLLRGITPKKPKPATDTLKVENTVPPITDNAKKIDP